MLPYFGRSALALAAQHGLRPDRLLRIATAGASCESGSTWPASDRACSSVPSAEGSQASTSQADTPQLRHRRVHTPRRTSLTERLEDAVQEPQPDSRPVSAVAIIERYPIVFPEGDVWRADFDEWQQNWNAWKYKTYPAKWLNCDKQTDGDATASTFQAESRITEADRDNNIRSLRRCTPGFLYLLFDDPSCHPAGAPAGGGAAPTWRFPQTEATKDESLRDAIGRAVTQSCGASIETHVFGNVPCAHVEGDANRAFCMLGVVLDGNVELVQGAPARDYAWLTKREVVEAYAGDEAMLPIIDAVLEE